MAFALSDFKKTTRKSGDERVLYPYIIKDDRYLSAIAFAIDYFERMVGRRRAEIDPATLLEFFGDPRLARGLVACLSRTYTWRHLTVREVVDERTYARLEELGLTTPEALRACLHSFVNRNYDGFLLPEDRRLALELFCSGLPISAQQLEELMLLDAEDEAVLTKIGPTPAATDIVTLYNFHSLETALRHSSTITLRLNGPVWAIVRSIHNLARRYGLLYEVAEVPRDLFSKELTVIWHGRRDAMGGWSRHGRRLVRGLLRLLAAHPDCPVEGEARVSLQGRSFRLVLDRRVLAILGVEARRLGQGDESWEHGRDSQLALEWSKAAGRGATRGWRLRRDPEPLAVGGNILVPDFLAVRGAQQVPVFVPSSVAGAVALARIIGAAPGHCLVIVPAEAVRAFKGLSVPLVPYAGAPDVADIVAALDIHFPHPAAETTLTRWQRLERMLAEEGFIAEEQLRDLLGCSKTEEVAAALRGWADGTRTHYLAGLGLCTTERLETVRRLLAEAA